MTCGGRTTGGVAVGLAIVLATTAMARAQAAVAEACPSEIKITELQVNVAKSCPLKVPARTSPGGGVSTITLAFDKAPVTFPARGATDAVMLSVAATKETVFVTVEASPAKSSTFAFGSDIAASQHELLVPYRDGGYSVNIAREDAGSSAEIVTVSVRREALVPSLALKSGWYVPGLDRGYAYRQSIAIADYVSLARVAQCEYVNVDRQIGGCAGDWQDSTVTCQGGVCPGVRFPTFPSDCQTDECITVQRRLSKSYRFVSALLGRMADSEFFKEKRASRSEPIVLFVGLGNINRLMLLDCRGLAHDHSCDQYAEPTEVSLERASYVWVAYIEDDQVPFDTSLDVRFGGNPPQTDREEFDLRAQDRLRPSLPGHSSGYVPPTGERIVRVGFKRIPVREAPTSADIRVTRQGAAYGLKTWNRVFKKFSDWPAFVTANVFIPGVGIRGQQVNAIETKSGVANSATKFELVDTHSQVFASAQIRFPQVRARAADASRYRTRLAWQLIPDVTLPSPALAPDTWSAWYVGISWPILFDRISFGMGFAWVHEETLNDSGDAIVSSWKRQGVAGLSIELVRMR